MLHSLAKGTTDGDFLSVDRNSLMLFIYSLYVFGIHNKTSVRLQKIQGMKYLEQLFERRSDCKFALCR